MTTPSPSPAPSAVPSPLLTPLMVRERFRLPSMRAARALMRSMRHVECARGLWTTEEWVAAWLAARALPGTLPEKAPSYNPLEAAVVEQTVSVVRALVARGELMVGPQLRVKTA